MYLLKYLENSDASCRSAVEAYADRHECFRQMQDEYNKTKASLGIEDLDLPDPEEDDETGSVSGYISDNSAFLREGCDTYQWEIIEEPRFITAESMYIVSGVYHDLENGDIYHCTPVACYGKAQAQQELQKMFEERLAAYDLIENGTSDEEGNSIPGGCIWDGEATIYSHAEYAFDCLVEVASFAVSPVQMAGPICDGQINVPGVFISVWDDDIAVSSKCLVNFKTGEVTVICDNDYPGNDDLLNVLHKQYVEVGDCRYPVVEKEEYLAKVAAGELTGEGLNEEGVRVLWYE